MVYVPPPAAIKAPVAKSSITTGYELLWTGQFESRRWFTGVTMGLPIRFDLFELTPSIGIAGSAHGFDLQPKTTGFRLMGDLRLGFPITLTKTPFKLELVPVVGIGFHADFDWVRRQTIQSTKGSGPRVVPEHTDFRQLTAVPYAGILVRAGYITGGYQLRVSGKETIHQVTAGFVF
ncbi:Hypothetical protein A7982_05695 [Minicystis rosea]|nr:Hypothetical protein A7982_05695 [Minicystis rosea]